MPSAVVAQLLWPKIRILNDDDVATLRYLLDHAAAPYRVGRLEGRYALHMTRRISRVGLMAFCSLGSSAEVRAPILLRAGK